MDSIKVNTRDPIAAAKFVKTVALEHGSDLQRFLVKRLRAGEEADDVAQEVYLRLLRLNNSELIRQPMAYMYFLASQIIGEFRMRASKRPIACDSEDLDRMLEETAHTRRDGLDDREHIERLLEHCLASLNKAHRAVLLLRKRDGFSIPEIAQHLQLSHFKVKRYLVEANRKIVELQLRHQER